jgi:hypothetical protein
MDTDVDQNGYLGAPDLFKCFKRCLLIVYVTHTNKYIPSLGQQPRRIIMKYTNT